MRKLRRIPPGMLDAWRKVRKAFVTSKDCYSVCRDAIKVCYSDWQDAIRSCIWCVRKSPEIYVGRGARLLFRFLQLVQVTLVSMMLIKIVGDVIRLLH